VECAHASNALVLTYRASGRAENSYFLPAAVPLLAALLAALLTDVREVAHDHAMRLAPHLQQVHVALRQPLHHNRCKEQCVEDAHDSEHQQCDHCERDQYAGALGRAAAGVARATTFERTAAASALAHGTAALAIHVAAAAAHTAVATSTVPRSVSVGMCCARSDRRLPFGLSPAVRNITRTRTDLSSVSLGGVVAQGWGGSRVGGRSFCVAAQQGEGAKHIGQCTPS
jgi:hypothetical protein